MTIQELNQKLLAKYGELQMVVAIEELSELQKELCKALRNKADRNHILEEVADVEIVLSQVKLLYNLSDEAIIQAKTQKVQRTIERYDIDKGK